MYVTVTKQNAIPYLGSAQIIYEPRAGIGSLTETPKPVLQVFPKISGQGFHFASSRAGFAAHVYNANGGLVYADSVSGTRCFWRGRNRMGKMLPAGAYFVKLQTERQTFLDKVVLLR